MTQRKGNTRGTPRDSGRELCEPREPVDSRTSRGCVKRGERPRMCNAATARGCVNSGDRPRMCEQWRTSTDGVNRGTVERIKPNACPGYIGGTGASLTWAECFVDRFCAVLHVQLVIDTVDMLAHGADGDVKTIGDLLVEKPL